MLSRSAGSPLVLGLGTAAILAAGTAPVLAADDAPAPKLTVTVTASPTTQEKPGEPIVITAIVSAEGETIENVTLKSLTAKPADLAKFTEPECRTDCKLGDIEVGADNAKKIEAKIGVPADIKAEQTVTVRLLVVSEETDPAFDTVSVKFMPKPPTTKPPSPSPTPTTSPTLSPGKGKGPSDGKEGKEKDDDDSDNDSSGSGSSSGGSNGSGSSGSSYTPPSPNASFTPPATPGVSLPSIAPPNPSVAPGQLTPTPESRLRNNKAPVAQDLTFEQMASTQVAWLAALLAAFSLLLTQLRLGRRRAAPGTAAAVKGSAAPKRSKGAHRRPRRGVFGK
ncbi:hypothetical protein [Actinomadura miaoliensis]|uniref:DUF11 domain-containing protein n=1 Tax=Actinomadura miaoliensis TaxID=430685 RepID=A0ABP7W9V3_9ACTN